MKKINFETKRTIILVVLFVTELLLFIWLSSNTGSSIR